MGRHIWIDTSAPRRRSNPSAAAASGRSWSLTIRRAVACTAAVSRARYLPRIKTWSGGSFPDKVGPMDTEKPPLVCPECEQIVWPNEEKRLFLGSKGDPEKEPEPGDAFGIVTHEKCGDAFAARLEAAKRD
jgi:hypothetical protein